MSNPADTLSAPNHPPLCVQLVTRARVDASTHNGAVLSWPTIPLDILKEVIEQSPRKMMRTWSLVSKFCYACATPALWRHMRIQVRDTHDTQALTAMLVGLVKGGGRNCRRLRLLLGPAIFDDVMQRAMLGNMELHRSSGLFDAMLNSLGM
jgi:hypothetical protein